MPPADLDHVLAHVPWEELRVARIFITGGTGFFGKWLLETFAHANRALDLRASAVVLSRRPPPARDAISFVEGDVRSFTFPPGEFSHVIHAAANFNEPVPPDELRDVIVGGTQRVLDFASACGARKFLLTSSGAVYGPQPPDLSHIPETFRCAPDTPYGEARLAAEQFCAGSGLDVKIVRCFAFLGPGLPLDAHYAIGNFIRDALAGGPIRIRGDGSPVRSYLYAADLAIWLWTIFFQGEAHIPYNVGSYEPITIADAARAVARAVEPPLEVQIAGTFTAPSRYVPTCERARGLGLRTWVMLDEQIRRTLAWHRASA